MVADEQDATYDLCFCIAMSTPNILQNAESMSVTLFRDSSFADGVFRSSMYTGSPANIGFPGSPGSSVLFSYSEACDNATGSMSKNASHIVGLSTAPRLATLREVSSTPDGGISFLNVLADAAYTAGVRMISSSWLPMAEVDGYVFW